MPTILTSKTTNPGATFWRGGSRRRGYGVVMAVDGQQAISVARSGGAVAK